jgi:hypothetical protein
MYITTRNKDGTVGDLIIPTFDPDVVYANKDDKPQLFSFGLSDGKFNVGKFGGKEGDEDKPEGYTVPICMYNRNGATEHEKKWVESVERIIEATKEYVLSKKKELKLFDLERSDLKSFDKVFYWKKDKNTGEKIKDVGPTLYAKVIVSKKSNKFVTQFYDYNGNSVDPMNFLGKYCYGRFAIKIESIFFGNKISLQVKLFECELNQIDNGQKRLLSRPPVNQVKPPVFAEESDDDEGSLKSDNEDSLNTKVSQLKVSEPVAPPVVVPEPVATPVVPSTVKKVIRRKKNEDE